MTYKYKDLNGNTYALQVDHIARTFKKDHLISISDKISATKTSRKHLKALEKELKSAGYIEILS